MTSPEVNFADVFCRQAGLAPEQFLEGFFKLAVYPHARLLLPMGEKLSRRDMLTPDRELLADIGRAGDLAAIRSILSRMPWYYGSRWRVRQRLRLRVSSRRVLAAASRVLTGAALSRERRP